MALPRPVMGDPPPRLMVVIPIRGLEEAKSRLGDALDAEERRDLVTRLTERTIAAARAAGRVDSVLVVSPDPATLELAVAAGARALRQRGRGLNRAVEEASALAIEESVEALLVLPGDLPFVDGPALDALIAVADADDEPLVALVTDRHGRGTNALLLRPPDVIASAFGGDSREAHALRARAAGARYVEREGPLGVDLDTPEDLLLVDDMASARDEVI